MPAPAQVTPGLSAPKSIARLRQEYGVNIPSKAEVIWQPLYDYQATVAAATASQLFFQVPNGQSSKTLNDTNMDLGGQLPAGQMFIVTGIEVDYTPDLTISNTAAVDQFLDDVFDFYRQGNLVLNIGSKAFLKQGPLMSFPPTRRISGFTSITNDGAAAVQGYNYALASGREFQVRGLMLQSTQNFSVDIQNRLATSTTGRCGVKLNGWLIRNAQ